MMAKKITEPALAEKINLAIADHIAQREDSHGFSKLDQLLGEIETNGANWHKQLEEALTSLLPRLSSSDARAWEATRMLVEAAQLNSLGLARRVMRLLDKDKQISDVRTRFQAFLTYRALGGPLIRPRLDDEKALRSQMKPQWVDLVLSAYNGAPDSIISFLEEQVSTQNGNFTWTDVRRRLPLILRLLGTEFNRGIVRITNAIPNISDREKLSEAIKASFKIDPMSERRMDAAHFETVPIRTRRVRLVEDPDVVRRRNQGTFNKVILPGIAQYKRMRDEEATEA